MTEALSVLLLVAVLAWAVVRPWGWVESVVAVPAAGLAILSGAISLDHVQAEAERMGPVIGFLAAVLVLARLCDDEGLFHASGTWMARLAGPHPQRLLMAVFGIASLITAVLSLDATVVLLTPWCFRPPLAWASGRSPTSMPAPTSQTAAPCSCRSPI